MATASEHLALMAEAKLSFTNRQENPLYYFRKRKRINHSLFFVRSGNSFLIKAASGLSCGDRNAQSACALVVMTLPDSSLVTGSPAQFRESVP